MTWTASMRPCCRHAGRRRRCSLPSLLLRVDGLPPLPAGLRLCQLAQPLDGMRHL